MLTYVCRFRTTNQGALRYEYGVTDTERTTDFAIGFTIDPEAVRAARGNGIEIRRGYDRRHLFQLWSCIKVESPGTFLEARDLGWIPSWVDEEPNRFG